MESGVADFDEALRLRPDDAAACYSGGYAMARVGRNDGAVDDLRTGLELAQEGGGKALVAEIQELMQELREKQVTRRP